MLFVHRLHRFKVLLVHAFDGAAAVAQIPLHAAQQAHVRVHLDVHLEIQQVAHFRVVEHVDALQQHHVRRLDQPAGIAAPVLGVVVFLGGDGLAAAQLHQILPQHVVLEDFRLVIVQMGALLERHVRVILVVGILLDVHAGLLQPRCQRLCQRGFAAAAGPADTDDQHGASLPVRVLIPIFYHNWVENTIWQNARAKNISICVRLHFGEIVL